MLTPDLDTPGGVSGLLATLRDFFSVGVEYFTVGKRLHESSWFAMFRRFLGDIRRFRRTLDASHYDVVHVNPSLEFKAVIRDGVFVILARRAGVRTVVMFHGWKSDFEASLKGWRLCVFKRVFAKADAVLVLASELREKLEYWGFSAPITVETTAFHDALIRSDTLDQKLRRRRGEVRLLFFSRVERTKGIYETLDAYAMVKARRPLVKLTVAGSGTALDAAKQYAADRRLPDISWVGYVQGREKARVLEDADVFILPTYTEGLPVAVLEAMAFGLAIVTRPVGGLRDIIIDGQSGYLIEGKDPAAFAGAIERLIEDPDLLEQMSRNNHCEAVARFAASAAARRLEALYERLVCTHCQLDP